MSASIALASLSWSTPEGRRLLSNLDLSFIAERTGLVGRNGVGKTTLLKLVAGDLPPQAGRVSVNGTLGMLRQTAGVGADETVADLFGVRPAIALLERAEDGEVDADELAHADWTLEARLVAALARFGLDATP
jgi:ATPase subunit of ABC transporter with duplicated ATPase domains